MASEGELFERLLLGYIGAFTRDLAKFPEDKWDWTPDLAAPTARMIATHVWQWLVCDRQHLEEPDVTKHRLVPEPPTEPKAMISLIETERENWERLLSRLIPGRLDDPVRQFGDTDGNVRGFVGHMLQNTIYKCGQLSVLYFALGLDGKGPYEAPLPNAIYEEVWAVANGSGS